MWERDGVTLAGGSADGVLTVHNIQKSGNYTCIAVNNRGKARALAYVTVRSKSNTLYCLEVASLNTIYMEIYSMYLSRKGNFFLQQEKHKLIYEQSRVSLRSYSAINSNTRK